jgi:hypothetical protein
MKTITEIIREAQALLNINFNLQDNFKEELTDKHITFFHIIRIAEMFLPALIRPKAKTGRPPYPFHLFIRSMLGKLFFTIDTTRGFIDRLKSDPNLRLLCGFDKVPDESTFSRIFSHLSKEGIWYPALDALVKEAHEGKVVYHSCRDSTMVPAREKAAPKADKKAKKPKKKRGRKPKNVVYEPKEPTNLEKQVLEEAAESLEKLNKTCAFGCKKNSQGKIEITKGYKLHLDVSDAGFPLTAVITGANVHDSQLAIPMEKLTEQKVTFCYSLMDAAYDAKTISGFIQSRGRVPIIDVNKRNDQNRAPLCPAQKERYKIRSAVERANSHLKDNLIPKALYVKGYTKVAFVLMASVFCLAILKYLQFVVS